MKVLLFIELKNLDKIVQLYGQEFGDLLIENAGVKIQEQIQSNDYVFRFEGNQFAVLLCSVKNELGVSKAAQKLYETITLPYYFKGNDIIVGCSMGAAVFPYDAEDKKELVQKAASAMLEALRNEITYILYDPKMYQEAFRRLELESAAYRAIEEQQFQLLYQPIVDETFAIVGAEALLRWEHPRLGYVSPLDFIPVAEQSDLIFAIGKWVLYTACKRIAALSSRYDIYVSYNMSSREFSSPDLVEKVRTVVENVVPIDPRFLKIEITENEAVHDIEASISRITALSRIGVEVLIDDFGTGNSSLQYLRELPAKILKIDRAFVNEIEKKNEEREFLYHIVQLARLRGKTILIEGVENREQTDILLEMGCTRMQGYYFSKPVTADELESLVKNGIGFHRKI
jgi:diguanylate cyclase (GGDEF)-like protein